MCIAPYWRKWEDVRYSTFLGRRHDSRSTHSLQTRSWNKMAMFWSYFRDFVGVQKIEDLTESKTFFSEVLQITSRFVLAKKKKKKIGVRCNRMWFSVFCILIDNDMCHHSGQNIVDSRGSAEWVHKKGVCYFKRCAVFSPDIRMSIASCSNIISPTLLLIIETPLWSKRIAKQCRI